MEVSSDWAQKINTVEEKYLENSRSLELEYERLYSEIQTMTDTETRIQNSNELRVEFTEKQAALLDDHESLLDFYSNQALAEITGKRYLGRIGKFIEPVLAPIGIDWQGSVALIVGFIAKEFVVSTFGILYGFGGEEGSGSSGLISRLQQSAMTPLSAFVLMVFTLIYTPCLATVAAIKQETNSWKWTLFSITYSLVLAWVLSFIIYQGGLILGIGA